MSANPALPDPAAHLAAMVARAERRRGRLEELAEVGMALAKEMAVRLIDGPYHPEPSHDPGKSFAAVSRAVRLTLALEAKVDAQIFSLCNGEVPSWDERRRASTCARPLHPGPPDSTDEASGDHDTERESLVDRERPDSLNVDAAFEVIHSGSSLARPLSPAYASSEFEAVETLTEFATLSSPPAGEGGACGGSDEGSRPTFSLAPLRNNSS